MDGTPGHGQRALLPSCEAQQERIHRKQRLHLCWGGARVFVLTDYPVVAPLKDGAPVELVGELLFVPYRLADEKQTAFDLLCSEEGYTRTTSS